jgi:hypothetical protein
VDQHPALGLLGKGLRVEDEAAKLLLVARVDASAALDEVSEGEAGQRAERAIALEAVAAALRRLLFDATAQDGFAEVGVSEGKLASEEAGAAALLAGLFLIRRNREGPPVSGWRARRSV